MACTSILKQGQTLQQRMTEIDRALKRLEQYLATGVVQLVIGPNGAVAIRGWNPKDRDGMTDVCTVRSLMATNSQPFKMALLRAEAISGKKMNPQMIGQGVHSHDGGRTWGKH